PVVQLGGPPSLRCGRCLPAREEAGIRFGPPLRNFGGGDASGDLSLRLFLPPRIGSRHSIPSSRVSVRREGSEAVSISSLGSPVGGTVSVAPNRRIHSRKMPPENPVSAHVRAATQAARKAAARLDTHTPDRKAPRARPTNTVQRPTAGHETFDEIRKRSSCFRGAWSSTARSNRLRPKIPPRTSRSQESNSPPALTVAPAAWRSFSSAFNVSSGGSRSSRQ